MLKGKRKEKEEMKEKKRAKRQKHLAFPFRGFPEKDVVVVIRYPA